MEQIIQFQPKGLITVPKKLREAVGLGERALARIKEEKGRLIIEPVRTLPYSVRGYTDQEIKEFVKLDREERSERLKLFPLKN